jgi:SAM-dependent methyltransferase
MHFHRAPSPAGSCDDIGQYADGMPWVAQGYMKYIPSSTWQAEPQLGRVLGDTPADARIIDLGAGGRVIRKGVITVDFLPAQGTRVLGDGEHLPFGDGTIDLVVGTGLLEHVRDERRLLREVYRVLKPGGRAHFEVPFLENYHADPIDSRRFTVPGLVDVCRMHGLEPSHSGVHIGPTVTVLTTLRYYVALVFEGRSKLSKIVSTGAFAALSVLSWPFKFLDRFLIGKPSAHRLAFGVYCTATKVASAEAEVATRRSA